MEMLQIGNQDWIPTCGIFQASESATTNKLKQNHSGEFLKIQRNALKAPTNWEVFKGVTG